jgi:hypothetical protein
VVVLKWKRGESAALATLSPKARRFLTPFIELVSVPTDLDTGEQTMALDKHVGTALDRIVKCWGTTDPFFLDPIKVAADTFGTKDGTIFVFAEAKCAFRPT